MTRKFEIQDGNNTWFVTSSQDAGRRSATCKVELASVSLNYQALRERFLESGALQEALLGIDRSIIVSDLIPDKYSLTVLGIGTAMTPEENYGEMVAKALAPLACKEVEITPSASRAHG